MRFLVTATAALALLAVQAPHFAAHAQATAPVTSEPVAPAGGADTAAPAAAAGADSTAPVAPAKHKKTAHHQTLQQHFDAANTTHDGKLTKDQAAAANWSYVVKNFAKMDKANHGYVTASDIHNFAHEQHAAHAKKPATAPASNG